MDTNLRVGIIAATKPEARMLGRLVEHQAGHLYKVGNTSALVAIAGMGSQAARTAFYRLLEEKVQCMISWGTACALVPHLKQGQILFPAEIINIQNISQTIQDEMYTKLKTRLTQTFHIESGTLIESPQVLSTPQQRGSIAPSGAVAADMESYTLANLSAEHHLSFIVLRCVIDELDTQLPRSCVQAIDTFGNINPWKLASQLLGAPQEVVPLLELAKKYYVVRKNMRMAWKICWKILSNQQQKAA